MDATEMMVTDISLAPRRGSDSKEPGQARETRASGSLPTPGRALAWLLLFVALLVGSAFIYASLLGAYIALFHPEVVKDDALLESFSFELMWGPSGLAWSTMLDFLLLVPVILWASNFRSQPWQDTLALRWVPGRVFGFWLLVYCGFFFMQFLLNLVAPMDLGELIGALAGSRHLGVFLAFVLLAPVIEELVFRGYLFRAGRHTRLGLWGTLLLTSLLFTAIHAYQYPWVTLLHVFALSMLLGLAREKSGSLWVPIALHALNNAVAMTMLLFFDVY